MRNHFSKFFFQTRKLALENVRHKFVPSFIRVNSVETHHFLKIALRQKFRANIDDLRVQFSRYIFRRIGIGFLIAIKFFRVAAKKIQNYFFVKSYANILKPPFSDERRRRNYNRRNSILPRGKNHFF